MSRGIKRRTVFSVHRTDARDNGGKCSAGVPAGRIAGILPADTRERDAAGTAAYAVAHLLQRKTKEGLRRPTGAPLP